MSKKLKLAVLLLNGYDNDSRVIKETNTLKHYFSTDVFALNHGTDPKKQDISDNLTIYKTIYYKKPRNFVLKKLYQLWVYISYLTMILPKLRKYDIVHCNDLETLPFGVLAKLFNRQLKVIYDAHEYETETLSQKGMKKKISKLLEKTLIPYTDKILTVSNAIADEYKKLYNIEKPTLVLNTPPFQKIKKKNIFREKFDISEQQTIFLYQGGFSKGRGIEILLETFASINNEKIVAVFMGYGPLEDMVQQYAHTHKNIYFHPAVEPNILLDYTSSADFGLLFYENNCLNHYYCSPNKMFEYLMAEIPVIVSNLYEMKKIIEQHDVGIVVNDFTVDGLQNVLHDAIRLDKQKLHQNILAVKSIYNWEKQEENLLHAYGIEVI